MKSRSGRLGHERPAVKAFNIPNLSAHLPYQGYIEIIFRLIAKKSIAYALAGRECSAAGNPDFLA